ncbi:hypothetical protein [Hymenobacter metallilatus]|uniref:Uncharacterized protein n=1 Tax=Hymenobacter metallilatus TaxID=2493666 RepID=A0A3R9UQ57_9BACT|nr:hypothetical protein [Hymenobacter metallilatus]RSK37660.1 hypothetical protein EI290_03185 [Hymenobacter metallilatus]
MRRTLLFLSLFAIGSRSTHAQVLTDATRASAALDSLLQAAAATKQQVQTHSSRFATKTPWSGKRRQRVRGFAPGASARFTWEQKTVLRRNGTTATRFTALQNGKRVLRERRLNGQLEYLWLKTDPSPSPATASTTPAPAGPAPGTYGVLLHGGYLRWNRNQYVLPSTAVPGTTR